MKYFLGLIATVALIVVVFILILHGFKGSGSPKNQIVLTDYATSATVVRLTVNGPVNADQNHQGYRITIGRDANTIEVLKGYGNEVVQAKTYSNNPDAYADFLRALQLQNYTKGNTDPEKADTRGVCALGSRYTFEIQTANETVQKLWTSSCGGGTFKGNSTKVRSLFRLQIPDFDALAGGVKLGS